MRIVLIRYLWFYILKLAVIGQRGMVPGVCGAMERKTYVAAGGLLAAELAGGGSG